MEWSGVDDALQSDITHFYEIHGDQTSRPWCLLHSTTTHPVRNQSDKTAQGYIRNPRERWRTHISFTCATYFYSGGLHRNTTTIEQTLIDVQYRYSAHHQSRSSTSSPFPRVVAACEYIELWMAEELTLINFLWAHFEGDPFTSRAQRDLSFKWLSYYCYSTGASRRVPLSVSARLMNVALLHS